MSDISLDTARCHVIGLGCERGTPPAEVLALAIEAIDVAAIGAAELTAIASIDSRRLE
ncbi:cobalamin biosynthesis protein, partial [Rhizobium ruizarguesonis]